MVKSLPWYVLKSSFVLEVLKLVLFFFENLRTRI